MQPFVLQEFNTWKSQVDTNERTKTQVERVNVRESKNIVTYVPRNQYYEYYYVSHTDKDDWDHSDGYMPHSDYEYGHKDTLIGGFYDMHADRYTAHRDTGGGHGDYDYTYHKDTGGYTDSRHVDKAAYTTTSHSDVGFDHNDFVPSVPRLYDLESSNPTIRDTVTLGFYSYDKNRDGQGSQDTRSKAVFYTVRIRKVKNLDGAANVGSWATLVNNKEVETYSLNTKSYAEGYYEIEVTARNATQTQRDVTQTYESTKLVKTVKIQQNQDPAITVSNPTTFINFTFGLSDVRTPAGIVMDYADYADTYNLSKYNGILLNLIVVDQDKAQYLKGTGWVENSGGVKIAGTEFNIIWENGSSIIKSDGIADLTGQLFIPKDSLKTLTSGSGYKIAVQIKDYLDAACTQPAGATIIQRTVSKTNTTSLLVAVDMVVPTVTFGTPSSDWRQDATLLVKVSDDYIGVDKWRYRILIDGVKTKGWSSYRTAIQETISFPESGRNKVEVELIDKAGNMVVSSSKTVLVDKTKPSLSFTVSPTGWTAGPVTITAKGTDAHSGVFAILAPGGNLREGDSIEHIVNANGIYTFEVVDDVGNIETGTITVSNIDDVAPADFEVKAKNVETNLIELEIIGAKDDESGLHATPYRFSKDGGATWTSWQASPIHKFTGLKINELYNCRVQVRDVASNLKTVTLAVSTLTNDIDLIYSKTEGSNEVNLEIKLSGNPVDTETMITRQNMLTGELVVIKDWSKTTKFRDRVPTFVTGYRYSAYARNKDGVIGNSATVVVKDIEKPEVVVKGFGVDKYVYDSTSKSLFLFGTVSGYMEIEAKTIATEKLLYKLTNEVGTVLKEGTLYGRVGEYRYAMNSPVDLREKGVYTLVLQAEYESDSGDGTLVIKDIATETITVYQIDSLAKLFDFQVTDSGANTVINYKNKASYSNPVYQQAIGNTKLQTELASLNVTVGASSSEIVNKGVNATFAGTGDIVIEKQMSGGTFREVFKQNSVIISTNISPFITKLQDEWSLEVTVNTSKGKFVLPAQLTEFKNQGFDIEVAVANTPTVEGTSTIERYTNTKSAGSVKSIASVKYNDSTVSVIGIKVKDILSTYHVATLNLQKEGTTQTATLDAVGNANIKYDGTFIFNKMNNIMAPHNEKVYDSINKKWVGELYYRTGDSGSKLLLITRNKIKVIKPSDLSIEREMNQANVGSALFANTLYIGTSTGLKSVSIDGTLNSTSFTESINAMTTDGYKLFVATNSGLHMLNSNLESTQDMIPNSDIFEGRNVPIKSLHASNGKVYVGESINGNKFTVLGK